MRDKCISLSHSTRFDGLNRPGEPGDFDVPRVVRSRLLTFGDNVRQRIPARALRYNEEFRRTYSNWWPPAPQGTGHRRSSDIRHQAIHGSGWWKLIDLRTRYSRPITIRAPRTRCGLYG